MLRRWKVFKKTQAFTVALLLLFAILWCPANGSWLIDARRFHISAHGQISCQECHEDIPSKQIHPDPMEVTKSRGQFFSPEHCLGCHEEVREGLDSGTHGRNRVSNKKKYIYCIRCHKVHYQLPIEDHKGRFGPGIAKEKQCAACHEPKKGMPSFFEEDSKCISCHIVLDTAGPLDRRKERLLCFHCHAKGGGPASTITSQQVPLIDPATYSNTLHWSLACTDCHAYGAAFNHGKQSQVNCLKCHTRHDEKKAHDAHMNVACGACHLQDVIPIRDPETKQVLFQIVEKEGHPLRIHEMIKDDSHEGCKRCHFKHNKIGAPVAILPAKSIICMVCHASTFSAGDTITIIAFVIFFLGLFLSFSYWLTGSVSGRLGDGNPIAKLLIIIGRGLKVLFSTRLPAILKVLILDVFFQRRLYRQSEARWWIHALIFYPFIFRFVWGLIALMGSLWSPEAREIWTMLDKNHMVTAFCFDLSGILILLGVTMAFCRETLRGLRSKPAIPKQDPWALFLIGGIVVAGFILEGMRMAMTGWPGDSEYALVGYWISRFFAESTNLTSAYIYLWYVHAILAGAFVAYIPFSRLFHIVMAPVVLVMNEGSGKEDR